MLLGGVKIHTNKTKLDFGIGILIVDESGCTIPNYVSPTKRRFEGVSPRPTPSMCHIQSVELIYWIQQIYKQTRLFFLQ